MRTKAQRGYILATKNLSQLVSESVRSYDQVPSLLVWIDRYLAILLFYASKVNSPFGLHCTKQEVLLVVQEESPGKPLENVVPETHCYRFLFNWFNMGPCKRCFLKKVPRWFKHESKVEDSNTRPKEILVLVINMRRQTQCGSIEW